MTADDAAEGGPARQLSPRLQQNGKQTHAAAVLQEGQALEPLQLSRLRRGLLLLLGVWMSLCGGTLYTFATWEVELMDHCNLEARGLGLIYSFGQLGVGFGGLLPGFIFDRFGPSATCAHGLLFTLLANLGLYAALQTDDCGGLPALCLLYLVLQNGSSGLYQAGLFSNVRSATAESRGTVVGLVAAGYGLSAALWSRAFERAFDGDLDAYLLGTAGVFATTAVLGAAALPACMRPWGGHGAYGKLQELGGTPIGQSPQRSDDGESTETATETSSCSVARVHLGATEEESHSCRSIYATMDFWTVAMAFSLAQAVGSGLFIANLALMSDSVGLEATERSHFVRMVSYFNCAGRVAAGLLMDFCEPRGVPRVSQLLWTSGSLFLVCLGLCLAPGDSLKALLLPSLIVIGTAYGANWAILPTFVASRFGSAHVGMIFNSVATLMSFMVLLTSYAVGSLYDAATATQQPPAAAAASKDHAHFCTGADCWRASYTVGVVLASLSFCCALVATRRACTDRS